MTDEKTLQSDEQAAKISEPLKDSNYMAAERTMMAADRSLMAWNIPLFLQVYQWDAEKKRFPMKPNPDFISRIREIATPTDTILVTCRSGGRSAMAFNRLAEAGFKNVFNITDGVEGDIVKDPESLFFGQHMINGWKNSGLPWTYEVNPERVLLPANR